MFIVTSEEMTRAPEERHLIVKEDVAPPELVATFNRFYKHSGSSGAGCTAAAVTPKGRSRSRMHQLCEFLRLILSRMCVRHVLTVFRDFTDCLASPNHAPLA